eukprot:243573-Pelagomonas_calceolata.AAC.2
MPFQVTVGGSVLQLLASLLQLRGCKPSSTPLQQPDTNSCPQHLVSSCATTPQLAQDSNEDLQQEHLAACNVLCYNGEIFGGLHVPAGCSLILDPILGHHRGREPC